MKLALTMERFDLRGWQHPDMIQVPIKEAMPFFLSGAARMAHRPRCGWLHFDKGRATHISFRMWCGQNGFISRHRPLSRLADDPDPLPICATCEGKATGAGHLGARSIAGRDVLFSPRTKR